MTATGKKTRNFALLDEYDAPFPARLRQARKNFNRQLWNRSLLQQVVHEGWGRLERSVKQHLAPACLSKIGRLILTGYRQDRTAGETADVWTPVTAIMTSSSGTPPAGR